jgi:SpoIID/LytB domain protein
MAGMLIVPLKKDFDRISKPIIEDIYHQVSQPVDEPMVSVGIMKGNEIMLELNGIFTDSNGKKYTSLQKVTLSDDKLLLENESIGEITLTPLNENCSFELKNVTIGIDFHWERQEDQHFAGSLKLIIQNHEIVAINILPVEEYLRSVISSEMSASASLELLKAHAVISRSWLLANMNEYTSPCHLTKKQTSASTEINNETEHIKWYERDAHSHFDVCADDHCQRYQGIARISSSTAIQAIEETKGEVLTVDSQICDTRFSKSCGGITETFENCWADTPKSYLTSVVDSDDANIKENFELDLTVEKNAEKWILHSPIAFCNTIDKNILSQILNNYDQETTDFYRWEVVYSQKEISSLLQLRAGIDFGDILDLIPILRGASGRLVKMKIVGSKRSIIVGKELEIRKWLSATHLYSSAFVVEKGQEINDVPQRFILKGAGWGHGVGLCQIGAAVMAEKGYDYKAILAHYYKGSELKKLYL